MLKYFGSLAFSSKYNGVCSFALGLMFACLMHIQNIKNTKFVNITGLPYSSFNSQISGLLLLLILISQDYIYK